MTHERHIIGALLQDPNQLDNVLEIIGPEEFSDRRAKVAYSAIIRAATEGLTPDLLTISGRIREQVESSWLVSTVEDVIPLNVVQYAREQAKIVRANKIRSLCHEAAAGKEPNEMLDKLYGGLSGLEEPERQKDTSAEAIAERYLRWVDDAKTGKIKRLTCHTPGLVNYLVPEDSIIPYWIGGLTLLLSAYTSSGKSQYAISLVLGEAEAGARVAVFSNEMGDLSYADRAAAYYANLPYGHIRYNKIHGFDEEKINNALLRFAALPLHVDDRSTTSDYIIGKIRRMQYGFQPQLCVVDYCQCLNPKKGESQYEGITRQCEELMSAAVKYDFSLVLISQIDNLSAREQDTTTNFMAMKGSGDVSARADIFCQLIRNPLDAAKNREIKFIVRKNRPFGKVGHKDLWFNNTFSKITDVHPQEK